MNSSGIFRRLLRAVVGIGIFMLAFGLLHDARAQTISAKDDYVTCWKQPCAYDEGIDWSKSNPNSVAVSVRMGQKAAVTDDQIKQVLIADLNRYGVTNVRFFFEKFKGNSSAIALHVRGGVEGVFGIHNIRDEIKSIARWTQNTNPVFGIN